MDQIDYGKDDADMALPLQEEFLNRGIALSQKSLQRTEEPDEDENGNRFCLDCGQEIPPARVQILDAVRCTHCASRKERIARLYAGGVVKTSYDEYD